MRRRREPRYNPDWHAGRGGRSVIDEVVEKIRERLPAMELTTQQLNVIIGFASSKRDTRKDLKQG